MHTQALASGNQKLGDRIVERPLRQFEGDIGAGSGLADGVTGDQPADDSQSGPGMRRQVGLAETMRRSRRAAWQRNGYDQWRRIRSVPQVQFGLQTGDAIVVRRLPRQPGLLARWRPAWVFAPRHGRRLIGDHGQRPGRERAQPPRHRQTATALQIPVGLEAAVIQRGERRGPVVQRQGRHRAATGDIDGQTRTGGHRNTAAIGLQEDRRNTRVGGRGDPGLQLGGRRIRP